MGRKFRDESLGCMAIGIGGMLFLDSAAEIMWYGGWGYGFSQGGSCIYTCGRGYILILSIVLVALGLYINYRKPKP